MTLSGNTTIESVVEKIESYPKKAVSFFTLTQSVFSVRESTGTKAVAAEESADSPSSAGIFTGCKLFWLAIARLKNANAAIYKKNRLNYGIKNRCKRKINNKLEYKDLKKYKREGNFT